MSISYKVVERIERKGWPTTSQKWSSSHREANRKEKAHFGSKAFAKVQKIVNKMPKNELLGTHTRKGQIKVSSRVPEENRMQIAYHEMIEHMLMTRARPKRRARRGKKRHR